ncbi:MAG: hypothetical protein ACOYWZ_14215 [Bacillota bacterium]
MALTSEIGSLKGWKLKTWLSKNKGNIRLIIAGLFGLLSAYVSGLNPAYALGLAAIVTAASKLVLDTLDFWISDVKIE